MNKKLSIAYVSPGWPLSSCPNGVVAYIENLLVGFGNKVTPCILAQKTDQQTADGTIVDLSSLHIERTWVDKLCQEIKVGYAQKIRHNRRCLRSSKKILAGVNALKNAPDLIEIEESFGIAKWLVDGSRIPVVTRLHGPWFICGTGQDVAKDSHFKWRVKSEGLAIAKSSGISAPSFDVLTRVREFYNIELPRAQVIPNPVPAVDSTLIWRVDNAAQGSLLYVGRFDKLKGGDIVIDAFRLIALQNKEVVLKFVGPNKSVQIDGEKLDLHQYIQKKYRKIR